MQNEEIKAIEQYVEDVIAQTKKSRKIIGTDQYSKEILEYAECYAKYLMALYYKYKVSKEQEIMNDVVVNIQLLLDLKREDNGFIYWGLPFPWGETTDRDGFLITTVFCLKSLFVWQKEGIPIEKHILRKAINWCFSLVNIDEYGAMGFFYSKKRKENIYNATSLACGVLANFQDLLSLEEKERLDRIILYIQSEQKRGYWNYSKSKVDVDLLHQCYTCEGILDYGKVTGNNDLLCTAIHGVKFVTNNIPFFETERYLFNIHDNENVLILCKHVILRGYQRFFPENWRFTKTRIWSLAALLRVLVTCWVETRELFYEEYADSLVRHIMKEISDSKKHLLVGNNNLHIRNTYHLLEALSFYLNVKEVGVAADSPR